jgi:hypothetical protein
MKQCPKCGTSYADDTLRYCLEDGEPLDIADLPTIVRTSVIPQAAETLVLQNESKQTVQRPAPKPDNAKTIVTVAAVFGVLSVLLIAGLGGVGAVYYYSSAGERLPERSTPVPTPTTMVIRRGSNDNSGDLERQIEELQRRLDQENVQTGDERQEDLDYTIEERYARVVSPGDGFLALRSMPSTATGERIAKIPHGTRVSVSGCGPYRSGATPGRWCITSYDGKFGWVFDGYLEYE